MSKILNVLQVHPHLPNPAGTGGRTANKNHGKSAINGMHVLAIIAAFLIVAGAYFVATTSHLSPTTSAGPKATPIPATKEIAAAIGVGAGANSAKANTGTATPVPTEGKEKELEIATDWYPITAQATEIAIKKYDTTVIISGGATVGRMDIVMRDNNPYKVLFAKINYRDKKNGKIAGTQIVPLPANMGVGVATWKELLGNDVDGKNVEWQAEFGLENKGDRPDTTKKISI